MLASQRRPSTVKLKTYGRNFGQRLATACSSSAPSRGLNSSGRRTSSTSSVMATLKMPSCKASSRALGNMAIPPAVKVVIASGHFPKSALHRRNTFSRTSESYGHRQIHDSSAALDLKSLNRILQRVSQGLQIGGTSARFEDEMTKSRL